MFYHESCYFHVDESGITSCWFGRERFGTKGFWENPEPKMKMEQFGATLGFEKAHMTPSLKPTVRTWKWARLRHPKRNENVFQPSIFREGREAYVMPWHTLGIVPYPRGKASTNNDEVVSKWKACLDVPGGKLGSMVCRWVISYNFITFITLIDPMHN